MGGGQKLSQSTPPTKPTPALVHSHNPAVHPGGTDDSRFTAECGYLQALAADHTELALVETKGTKAVGYRHPDEAWCNACARGLHLLQALLMGHEVADIAQEASQSPDEVRAEVAEGRLGECHLAKAVARCCGANSSASPLRP